MPLEIYDLLSETNPTIRGGVNGEVHGEPRPPAYICPFSSLANYFDAMTKAQLLMDAGAVDLSLTRITHQILEHNHPLVKFGIVGMQTRGVYLARRLAQKIEEIEHIQIPVGVLDTTMYRDDYRTALKQPKVQATEIPFDLYNVNVVLVDDVL